MADNGATTGSTKTKKSRSRSPNYPALNLADAVERTKMVFDKLGMREVGDEDIVKALGYNTLNGTSRSVASALKKYGLLQPSGDGFKISHDALDIINLSSDDPDRAKAMHEAALRPALFAELHETYGDNPPGDSLLRNYLFKRNFNPNVADEVIRLYRDTMDLVSRKMEEYTAADDSVEEQQETQMSQRTANIDVNPSGGTGTVAPAMIPGSFAKQQHYGLSEDCDVYLLFDGEPTKEDIAALKEYLSIFERRLPSEGFASGAGGAAPDGNAEGENGQPDE